MKLTRRSVSILVFVGALAVAVVAVKLYYRHVQHHASGKAQDLLDAADALSWNNRWADAAPLYGQAEKLFLAEGRQIQSSLCTRQPTDSRRMSPLSLPGTIDKLIEDLSKPEAQDNETRLRILTVLGTIENNYDASMARSTWMQVAASGQASRPFFPCLQGHGRGRHRGIHPWGHELCKA